MQTSKLTAVEAAELAGVDYTTINMARVDGELTSITTRQEGFNLRYYYDPAEVEAWAAARGRWPEGWITTTEAAKIVGYGPSAIRALIKSGEIEAVQMASSRKWAINPDSVTAAIRTDREGERPSGWVTTTEAAKRTGLTMVGVRQQILSGKVEGVQMPNGRWYVNPETLVAKGERPGVPDGWLSLSDAADICGYTEPAIRYWIKTGRVQAEKIGGKVFVEPVSFGEWTGTAVGDCLDDN